MTQVINKEVDVNAFYFVGKEMKTFPRRMEFGGRDVMFEDGLRLRVRRGNRQVCLFNMNSTDGPTYQLRQEGNQWTLVGTL